MKTTRYLSKSFFPKEVKVGDVVVIVRNKIIVIKDETEKLPKEIED
ncbi:DUF3006 domain-containing protein [Bacillus methanolicus]|nr:DUF3006 domain-containing protein [Bacillus methanolicus]